MDLLGEDSSEDESKASLNINAEYAKSYDRWRKNEELQKLKDKYGEDFEEETSTTSEEEDEDAVELTEDVEKDFFKTLSCLKEKNPVIYDGTVKFFKEKNPTDNDLTSSKTKKKEETLTMAAYQRKLLLETGGKNEPEQESSTKFEDLPMIEQEKELKESFKDLLQDTDSDDDGLLLRKEQSEEEKAKEEADYRLWLAGQDANVDQEDASRMKGLRDYWADPQLDDGEKFLRDYILNHRYLESNKGDRPENVLSSDSELEVAEQEAFEHKYNFRFEEPDQDFIKRYPRTVEQSMRKKDDRRKQKRDEVKARKDAERAKKDEELKRLKALKKAEILEKINKLKQVTGNEDLPFQEADVEGDFNPDEHDKRMSQLFSDEFYGETVDDVKPQFDDLDEELEIENWDAWDGTTAQDLHCEDPGFNMDCDYDGTMETQKELLENTKKRRKRRQSKFAVAAAMPKPVFDPKSKSFEQYLDEYYALDYEDLIGDIPCRFKYRKTVPNDFGLSVEEILAAPDKELNKWVSVKKIMKRRGDDQELYDVQAYRKKAQSLQKKMQCLPSLYAAPEEVEEEVPAKKKRKKKKKKMNGFDVTSNSAGVEAQRNLEEGSEPRPKLNKNKLVNKEVLENSMKESRAEEKVAAISTEGKKRRKRKRVKEDQGETVGKYLQQKKEAITAKNNVEEHYTILSERLAETDIKRSKKEKRPKDDQIQTLYNNVEEFSAEIQPKNIVDVNAVKKSRKRKKPKDDQTETLEEHLLKKTKTVAMENKAEVLHNETQSVKKKKRKKVNSEPSQQGMQKMKKAENNLTVGNSRVFNQPREGNGKEKFNSNRNADKKQKTNFKSFSSKREGDVIASMSDARLKSYGFNPKKFRNKLKYGNRK